MNARKSVEAGIRSEGDAVSSDPIRSNYFDLSQILDYWGPKRLNHHTEATSMLYAARECARLLVEEGMATPSSGTACTARRWSRGSSASASSSSATSRCA